MKRIKIAKEGPELSNICYGVWRIADRSEDQTPQAIRKKIDLCLEHGVTTFDHADIYGDYSCETLFGNVLAESPQLRSQMEIVTKAGIKLISEKHPEHQVKYYDTSRKHLQNSVEKSLKNLRTDYLDLFLIHRPDPFMDVEETSETLNNLVKSGKVKHIGVSNFSPSQFQLLDSYMDKPLVTNQIELSPVEMTPFQNGTIDQCQRLKMAPMAWSPLAGGRIFTEKSDKIDRLRKKLQEIGKRHSIGIAETAIAWLLCHPAKILPVIGSNNPERIAKMFKATEVSLNRQEWFEIWEASAGHEVP